MTAATFEASLFEHLATLFNGSSSVRDFRHWFSRSSWESDEDMPDDLYELASDIEHLGYIRDSGIWDDATYLQNLRADVDRFCSPALPLNQCRTARVA
jgi:hypothetical protein